MSTRCRIGYVMKNDFIRSIYCHHDGYPEGVGITLLKHYYNWGKIKELIDLGDISCLGPTIGVKHNFDDYDDAQTTAYGRDRGEKNVKSRVNKSRRSYANKEDWEIEYFYLFEDGKWEVLGSAHENQWQDLEEVLNKGITKNDDFEDGQQRSLSFEDDFEDVHGEGNPYESKNKIKGKLGLREEQMTQNNDTALKIQREAKKTALRLYKTIYDNLFLASQALLEMPKEYIDGSTFGPSGPFKQVYDKVKSSLDSMTSVSSPDSMTPEEVLPEPTPDESPSEISMGGDADLEAVEIQ